MAFRVVFSVNRDGKAEKGDCELREEQVTSGDTGDVLFPRGMVSTSGGCSFTA